MSYKIREHEALGESIRRIVCEEIEAAIAASRTARNGKGSPVHQTRKHLKKARAALCLLKSEAGHDRFQREDRRLRNVGRLISDIRDAEVRLATVKQLREEVNAPRGESFDQTEEMLAFELDSFLAAFAGWQDEAAANLHRTQAAIAHWHLHHLTRGDVCRSVRESYRRGRRALKRVRTRRSAKRFHELRKEAKTLAYQLRILRPLHRAVFGEMGAELKRLGEHLGHAHDLCFVADRLRSIAGAGASKRGRRALAVLLELREQDLWRAALAIGERFYALKPKEFSAQVARYFEERAHAQMREARESASIR